MTSGRRCSSRTARGWRGVALLAAGACAAGCGTSSPNAGPGPDPAPGPPALYGPPLLFSPTSHGFGMSVVLQAGKPAEVAARILADGAPDWDAPLPSEVRAPDLAQWQIEGLAPGTRYQYRIVTSASGTEKILYEGSLTTQRPPGAPFSFALVSDTHVGAHPAFANQGSPATLTAVSGQIAAAAPDFLVNLGDVLDFHEYGFNTPPPDTSITRLAYVNYRAGLADTAGKTPHYEVIGGWDSENGCNTPDEIERSRSQRLLYVPGPDPLTYPQGGSMYEDYYAFTWGDALFIVLNVFTYTPACHLLDFDPGLADDWTLGAAQLDWLRQTLAQATSKWRFILIHHPVGGAAGNAINSAYGRGGGLAANVGEQAVVHQLMRDHGVQVFFYGHDHVFTDMTVDGIHYSLPGSAGAPWKFTAAETGYTTYWPDSGWARVDVAPDSVGVHFISQDGTALYDFTLP